MASRKKRERPSAARRAAEALQPLPAPTPSNRGTFRVAEAQRQLASDLPTVVRNRAGERLSRLRAQAPLSVQPAISQGEAKRSPSRVVQSTRPAQPKLDKLDPNLKCRPKSNKPKAGGGSGRSFVPWGNC